MHNKQTSFLIFRVYYEKECKRKNVNKGKKVRIINTLINKKDILNTGKGILLKSLFDSLTLWSNDSGWETVGSTSEVYPSKTQFHVKINFTRSAFHTITNNEKCQFS